MWKFQGLYLISLSEFFPFCPRFVPPIFFLLPPIFSSTIGHFFYAPENQNRPYIIKTKKSVLGSFFGSSEADFLHDQLPLFTICPPRRGEDGEFEGCGGVSGVYEIAGSGCGCG